jgi:hypothetical protein
MDVSPLSSPQTRPDNGARRNSFHDRTLPALPLLSENSTATLTTLGTSSIERHPSVPIWPEQPQPIQRGGWLSVLALMGDIIVALTSTAFIVFGSLVLHFDGVPISEVSSLSVLNQLAILSDASRIVSFSIPVAHALEYILPHDNPRRALIYGSGSNRISYPFRRYCRLSHAQACSLEARERRTHESFRSATRQHSSVFNNCYPAQVP